MGHPESSPELEKELRAITGETGAGIVRAGDRTFVVVEVEPDGLPSGGEPYRVTDPEEAADLADALDDTHNPTYTMSEAMTYLRALRARRHGRR